MKAQTNFEIREYCKILRLKKIAENFESAVSDAIDYQQYLHDLLYSEIEEAARKSCEARIKRAHFPYRKYLEDIELNYVSPNLLKALPELATLDFIREGRNLILTGNPGTCKTHTAISLGIKACEEGFSVYFTTVPLLITEMKECNSKGKLRAFERKFEKYDLVIADELGYATFDRAGVDLLFTNLSLRAASKTTIITSNLTFERWCEVFSDPAVTSAMVDRLTYKSILIDTQTDSYRLRETLRSNGLSDNLLKSK